MTTLKKILLARNYIRTLPVYLCVCCSPQKDLILKDIKRWCEICKYKDSNLFFLLNLLLTNKVEFRNLLLHRLKNPKRTALCWIHYYIARIFWKPLDSLYLNTIDIGGGLYIQHGFATIVNAKRIGENCRILQQVTIGFKGTEAPVLEDNVSVACGAIVLGGITMHKNSIAGAGAVVLRDVPENAIVGGVTAKVLKYKTEDEIDYQG